MEVGGRSFEIGEATQPGEARRAAMTLAREFGWSDVEAGNVGIVTYKGLTEQEARQAKQAAIDKFNAARAAAEALEKQQTEELEKAGKQPDAWKDDDGGDDREAPHRTVAGKETWVDGTLVERRRMNWSR